MKILLACAGTRGDLQPLLALALALRSAGHQVHLQAPPTFRSWLQQWSLACSFSGQDLQARFAAGEANRINRPHQVFAELMALLNEEMESQYQELFSLAEGFDCILGASLQMAAFSAAEYFQIPYAYVAYCPAVLPSNQLMPFYWPWGNRPACLIPWMRRLDRHHTQLTLGRRINQLRKHYGLGPVPDLLRGILSQAPLLACYSEIAPCPGDLSFPVHRSGALHLFSEDTLAPDLSDYLESGSAPIYIGFGSMNDGRGEETTAAILQMVKHSAERFILARGWAGLGSNQLPENLFVIQSAPHDVLFPHVKAVVHHGGAGTTSMAAYCGKPQLIIPHLFDQFYWGQQIYQNALGPYPLAKLRFNASKLHSKVQQLSRPEFALRAEALGRRLRQYQSQVAAVKFVESLRI